MNSLCSQEQVAAFSEVTSLDGKQSVPLNGSNIPQAFCAPDKMTGFSRLSRFGMTYKPLTESHGEELLTLYREAFHARTSQLLEKAQELMEKPVECGEKWRGSFTKYNPDSCLWKTHQCSLLGDLDEFSETWPRWGLMRDGECWEQLTLAHLIKETESGLWLTPTVMDSLPIRNPEALERQYQKNRKGRSTHATLREQVAYPPPKQMFPTPVHSEARQGLQIRRDGKKGTQISLSTAVMTWPTPQLSDYKGATSPDAMSKAAARGFNPNLPEATAAISGGGQLNPNWVEWLMGWPIGFTDLKPLEMDKSPSALQQHGDS